ncbi:MAG: hypothetical protein ABSB19_11465 [Methylomonas sp.]|jgi:hypothetical protein
MSQENDASKISKVSSKKESAESKSNDLINKETLDYEKERRLHEAKMNQQSLGLLGAVFGAKANAITNINGLSTIIAGMVIVGSVWEVFFIINSNYQNSKELVSVPYSLASLSLGYIFGKAGK